LQASDHYRPERHGHRLGVFPFCGRNPKIIMRWPCHVKIGDQPPWDNLGMDPRPDPRWADRWWSKFSGTPTPDQLDRLVRYWAGLVPERAIIDGPLRLLCTARSLFAHSLYDVDFLPVAVLVAYQAVEAAFRVLYPNPENAKFYTLIDRAQADGHFSGDHVEWINDLRQMRNELSHPFHQVDGTFNDTVNMLTFAHQVVAVIMQANKPDWRR
jgi:hypothetical protein